MIRDLKVEVGWQAEREMVKAEGQLYAKEEKIQRAQNVLETKSGSALLETVKLEVIGDDQIISLRPKRRYSLNFTP